MSQSTHQRKCSLNTPYPSARETNKTWRRLRKPFACRRAGPAGGRCWTRKGGWDRRWGRRGHRRRAPGPDWCGRISRRGPPGSRRPRTACQEPPRGPTSALQLPRARPRGGCPLGCWPRSWSSPTRGSGSRRWRGTWGEAVRYNAKVSRWLLVNSFLWFNVRIEFEKLIFWVKDILRKIHYGILYKVFLRKSYFDINVFREKYIMRLDVITTS